MGTCSPSGTTRKIDSTNRWCDGYRVKAVCEPWRRSGSGCYAWILIGMWAKCLGLIGLLENIFEDLGPRARTMHICEHTSTHTLAVITASSPVMNPLTEDQEQLHRWGNEGQRRMALEEAPLHMRRHWTAWLQKAQQYEVPRPRWHWWPIVGKIAGVMIWAPRSGRFEKIEKINETKSLYFEKMNKIGKF